MPDPLAYLNGRYLPSVDPTLSPFAAGFVWGATATDRARTFHGELFRLDDHLARFRRSCEIARVPQPVGDDELASIATNLVAHNYPLADELSVVLFATPGPPGGPP